MAKKFHLAWFGVPGPGGSAGDWKRTTPGYDWRTPELYQDIARLCERARFDMVFLADSFSIPQVYKGNWDYPLKAGLWAPSHDPMSIMGALAVTTRQIGLVATMSTVFYPPYLLARSLASLDHMTRGRIGWNIVTSTKKLAAQSFGMDDLVEHDERYNMADEYLALCRELWASWEPDALVMDREADIFADPSKVRFVDFQGKYYRCKGPLNVPSSPQGHPVIVMAGASPRGQLFAAENAEVAFVNKTGVDSLKSYSQGLRARLEAAGRDPSSCKLFCGIKPVFGETESIAREKAEALAAETDLETGLSSLSEATGVDMSRFALDEPLPDDLKTIGMQSKLPEHQRTGRPTLREIARRESLHDNFPICGTAEQIADVLEEASTVGGADGFYLRPGLQNVAWLAEFVDKVVPVLQRRGLFRTQYTGNTLRHHLAEY